MVSKSMKTMMLGAGSLALLLAGPALAADMPVKAPVMKAAPPPPAFDVEFGGVIMSDYNFRGVSQSNRGASGGAYATAVWNSFFYVGIGALAIDWPASANYALSDPSAEVDYILGIRPKTGNISWDLGFIYYHYPREQDFESDFWEVYAKASYEVSKQLTVGGALYYSPDYLNYDIDGTTASISAKLTGPEINVGKGVGPSSVGSYLSGEFGHVWLGDTSWSGVSIPSYNYWNAGFGFTWKAITLDYRYHDTDLSGTGCQRVLNGGGPATRDWCSDAYIVKLSFDTKASDLK
jgi:uncharacterized protein (TIGR02001 family)